ncbi:MAG: Ig domain-containing protein [Gemmatimonadota bacterium]
MKRYLRFLFPGVAALLPALGACDSLLTDPAPPITEVRIHFAVEDGARGRTARAFGRANRVFLRLIRPDSAQRDTVVALVRRDGLARARLVLHTRERTPALGIYAQLRAGQLGLFEGRKVVRVEIGAPTAAEIDLAPIVAAVRAERKALLLTQGDTLSLHAAALFATGDTVETAAPVWSSEDPAVVAVSRGGLVRARKPGDVRLLVFYREVGDTVRVRVQPRG